MILSFLESIHEKEPEFNALVVCNKNSEKLKKLSSSYSFVNIIERNSLYSNLEILYYALFSHAVVISPLTFALKDNWKMMKQSSLKLRT